MKSPPLYSITLLFWHVLRSLPVRSLPVLWHGDDAELMGHLHHRGSSGGRHRGPCAGCSSTFIKTERWLSLWSGGPRRPGIRVSLSQWTHLILAGDVMTCATDLSCPLIEVNAETTTRDVCACLTDIAGCVCKLTNTRWIWNQNIHRMIWSYADFSSIWRAGRCFAVFFIYTFSLFRVAVSTALEVLYDFCTKDS